jgi:hypothetical protein
MLEADFYHNDVEPHLRQWGDYNRVESTTESGCPDISYAIGGIQGWIELKILHNDLLYFEKFQLAWLKKRLRHAHTNLWVFAADEAKLLVYSAEQVLKAPRTRVTKWLVVDTEKIDVPMVCGLRPWPWGKVLTLLTQHQLMFTPTKF